MTLIVCPPPSPNTITGPVPHHGFGATTLKRNGVRVWSTFEYEEADQVDLSDLAQWCDSGARWTIEADGPMSSHTYELHRIWRLPDFAEWQLTETRRGFA